MLSAETLKSLAERQVFIGTSSWKYPGWCGQLYDEQRYLTRKKFSEAKFERECLTEYAQTFPSVCVDAGYYKFPTEKWIEGRCAQVKPDFRFPFKVTDEITIKQFPNHARHGAPEIRFWSCGFRCALVLAAGLGAWRLKLWNLNL